MNVRMTQAEFEERFSYHDEHLTLFAVTVGPKEQTSILVYHYDKDPAMKYITVDLSDQAAEFLHESISDFKSVIESKRLRNKSINEQAQAT